MSSAYQPLHEGRKFPILQADGTTEYVTAKEFLAHRGRFNRAFPYATRPSPGAGSRREHSPAGAPLAREPAPPSPERAED